ncbi:hypothetical protein, partial [Mycobacterium tuberculosis]|uniref:hypothetical protein n=1 Tax=Mycobacterium tuberculosis TaxID=1773 RepID=UPI001BA72BCE
MFSAQGQRGGRSCGRDDVTMFARPADPAEADAAPPAPVPGADAAAKRPPAWSLSNWPVGWKVLAIVL